MVFLERLRRLARHSQWADRAIFAALEAGGEAVPADALHEFGHLVAVQEVWISRIEGRPPAVAVWPEVTPAAARSLMAVVHRTGEAFLELLTPDDLDRPIAYTTTDGRPFTDTVGDILLQVFLHGQYHRGRINRALRAAGCAPAGVDYIAWVRGGWSA